MAKKEKSTDTVFNPYDDIDNVLDGIEKSYGLIASGMDADEHRQSTGVLVLDCITGKGLTGGGWYTIFGQESCCKSTLASTIMANAIQSSVPIINYFDYEGSQDPIYLEKILQSLGVTVPVREIFGIRDSKNSKWLVKPRVRMYNESLAEKFFDSVAKLQRFLPDKIKVGEDYFYVYEHTKENISLLGGKYDKDYYQTTGKMKIPAENSLPQAIMIVDSYPAMLCEGQDVDDPGSALAMQARMFSDQIKRIKGKMKRKRVTVIGMNQERIAPMVRYGSPLYEPCGSALKFACMSSDTLLFTSKGLLYADEIFHEKNLPDVVGSEGLETPKAFDTFGISRIVEVTTDYGYSVKGKPKHKVLALHDGDIEAKWVSLLDIASNPNYYLPVKVGSQAFNLTEQELKYYPIKGSVFNNNIHEMPKSITVGEEFAKILGYLVSEGYVRFGRVEFSNTNDDLLEDFSKLFKSVFGVNVKRRKNGVGIHSSDICEFFVGIGVGGKLSRFKEVPRCIRKSPYDVQIAFLRTLFLGDGSLGKKTVNYSSSSNKLLDQIQLMLLNFGIMCNKIPYSVKYTDHHVEISADQNFQNMKRVLELDGLGRMHNLYNIGSLNIHGVNRRKFLNLIFDDSLSLSVEGFERSNILPDFFGYRNGVSSKFKEWLLDLKGDKIHFRNCDFDSDWYESALLWAGGLRTEHERKKNTDAIHKLNKFLSYTFDNSIVWKKVSKVDVLSEQMTYDFNMPNTHTVITNGIISHNSDARIKVSARANLYGKGAIDEEQSYDGAGVDKYRYIHVKAVKNKLFTPYLEGMMRVWIEDSNGKARGIDPVFDVFQYLTMTGQFSGKRNSFKILFDEWSGQEKSFKWVDLKIMVLGSKEERKALYERFKIKPLNLRKRCFDQLHSGNGIEMFLTNLSKGGFKPESSE